MSDSFDTDPYTECYEAIRRLARRLLGDDYELTMQSGDIASEAFLRAIASEQFEPESAPHLYSFVAKATRSVLQDYIRSKATEKRGHGQRAISLSVVADEPADPSAAVAVDVECLEDVLNSLGPDRAEIVLAHLALDRDPARTAEKLGVKPWTVRTAWSVFLARLQGTSGEGRAR